jgi:hypothetical protein
VKKEIADLWVQALRSGKYSQVKARLHKPGEGFCCLGVLCELSGQGKWSGPVVFDASQYVTQNDRSEQVLPNEVASWAGVHDVTPFALIHGHPVTRDRQDSYGDHGPDAVHLASLNDQGYTFAQIADVIEQHWESL